MVNNINKLEKKVQNVYQRVSPSSYPKKKNSYKTSLQTLKQCDLSAIYLDTMHASGNNLSNELRVTGLVRLHKIMSKDFRSYRDNTCLLMKSKKRLYYINY